ncbi:MAG TPA: DNA polymerase III subunit delta [Dinghuibacter sp.]|jgi:DNA polymerase-3 subunit delta|uniref:DNA polymerase III subunit delta n=1 Tax=Dinghuibacter sp. TaxID=2024697 RepID=UPI002BF19FA0|nr:DNA polymerase III subunit delta [Dinghuibacter sp.]HTJ14609.1 DNA polymerase III subunit delta [Dinghuibacter sp.]
MSTSKIIGDWQKKLFKPVYWLEGEEDYFIDEVVSYAENHILSEAEAGFNLTVFYGKDADWTAVINACRRYPMFAERQVVLLKEAQQMRDIDKLEGYIEHPQPSTVFVVSYKEKKVDGRSRLAKVLKEKGELLTTKKLYDNQLPEWAMEVIRRKGFTITPKGLNLLVEHIGNDLSRIASEIDKLSVNIGKGKEITEEDIENYVGISKEYNVFELQNALARKDLAGCIRIIQYFDANPKAGPIQMVLPALYNFFSKVYQMFGLSGAADKEVAAALGVNPFFLKDYRGAARAYGYEGVERVLLLLHQYNLKSLGVGAVGVSDGSLMKEMVFRMIA